MTTKSKLLAQFEMPSKAIFETGATSLAVNDLILFTDKTRCLVELRDEIYTLYAKTNHKYPTWHSFFSLFKFATENYLKEFKEDVHSWCRIKGINRMQYKEYCTLYANDFDNWKQEKNIKH